jgi:hypothetical protein
MPYSMEIRNAPHDVMAHDQDEVVRRGLLAAKNAKNPYSQLSVYHDLWETGHNMREDSALVHSS